MQQYYKQNNLEIGLDEAGRGCLLGPVFTAGVILNDIKSNWKSLNNYSNGKAAAVIKANAYGLGYEEVVECIENDVESFAVITLNEAISLRKHTKKPITLLQGVHEISD